MAKEDKGIDITDQAALQQAVGDDLFSDPSTKMPGGGEFFKFENVGDSIQGVLVMEPYEVEGKFGMQTVFVLQTPDGKEYNVALKNSSEAMAIRNAKHAAVGDIIAVRRLDDVDTGKGNPAHPKEVRVRTIMKS